MAISGDMDDVVGFSSILHARLYVNRLFIDLLLRNNQLLSPLIFSFAS